MTEPSDAKSAPAGTYWAMPDVLAGPHPRNRKTRSTELREAGITHNVDLTQGDHAISDFQTPTVPSMKAILQTIENELAKPDGRVYVHCEAGQGRTGTVIGCLLAQHGEAEPLARLTELRDGLPGSSPETQEQTDLVRLWAHWTKHQASI